MDFFEFKEVPDSSIVDAPSSPGSTHSWLGPLLFCLYLVLGLLISPL